MTDPLSHRALRAATSLAASLTLVLPAFAGVSEIVIVERDQLIGNDSSFLDALGGAVAIDGDTAVVGALLADAPGGPPVMGAGAVYVFTRAGTAWVQQAKLTADDAMQGQSFGQTVAIDGNTVVVGANTDSTAGAAAGAVYVFTRSGTSWSQQQKLVPADLGGLETFGGSVAIVGNTLVAGALFGSGLFPFTGAAYVFTRSAGSWTQRAKLFALDGVPLQGFGNAVTMSGATILVGASADGGVGAVYPYIGALSVWLPQAKITSPAPATDDGFGSHLSLSGDLAVIGVPGDDDDGNGSGSAWVFARSLTTWSQQMKLTASDGTGGDAFGAKVGISGTRVVVGASTNDDAGQSSGSAYLFERNGGSWTEVTKLTASDAGGLHRFGESVAIDGDYVLTGAPLAGALGTGAGYVHEVLGLNGSETCAGARAITVPTVLGTGSERFAFDNTDASTDGPQHTACSFFGDVWYCWTATCDATVTVETCGGTTVDTSIAVYDGCGCPVGAADLLGCDDDTCGDQSSVTFTAVQGDTYLIRIAGSGTGDVGFGTFGIAVDCDAVIPPCPFQTVTGTSANPPLTVARTLRTLYRLRDRTLRGTPVGERWIDLYYEHAAAMNRILRADVALRRKAGALVETLQPGLAALASGEKRAGRMTLPPRAIVLLDRVLRGLEEADADGPLARALRAEREALDLRSLIGATYAGAWERINAEAH